MNEYKVLTRKMSKVDQDMMNRAKKLKTNLQLANDLVQSEPSLPQRGFILTYQYTGKHFYPLGPSCCIYPHIQLDAPVVPVVLV